MDRAESNKSWAQAASRGSQFTKYILELFDKYAFQPQHISDSHS